MVKEGGMMQGKRKEGPVRSLPGFDLLFRSDFGDTKATEVKDGVWVWVWVVKHDDYAVWLISLCYDGDGAISSSFGPTIT